LTLTTTDLHEFLRSRRSVRRFKSDPVPDSVIERVLSTATFAPSAHNRQPWRFVVLTDANVKAGLAERMAAEFEHDLVADGLPAEEIEKQVSRSKRRIRGAPVLIVLCMETREMDSYPDDKRRQAERMMAVQSVAAAGQQLLLAAHAEGLGGVWVCSPLFAPEAVRRALELDESLQPQGMYFIGYPEDIPPARERKHLEDVIVSK
jgi:F420 biosynthesis protein FbiB-like protein